MEERSLCAVENDVMHQFHSIKLPASLIELYTNCDRDANAGIVKPFAIDKWLSTISMQYFLQFLTIFYLNFLIDTILLNTMDLSKRLFIACDFFRFGFASN